LSLHKIIAIIKITSEFRNVSVMWQKWAWLAGHGWHAYAWKADLNWKL